jgi:hypothetical protein
MGSTYMEVGTVVRALTTALSSLRDVVTLFGQVRYVHAFDLHFPFCTSDSYPLRNPLWLIAERSPYSFIVRRTFGTASLKRRSYVRG